MLGSFRIIMAALLLAGPALGQSAKAPDKAAARLRFKQGLEHVQRGDLEGAIVAFEAAYVSSPHFSVLYNIGQAQSALGRSLDAITSFERYLSEGGNQVSDARREEVRQLIESQRQRVGKLTISAGAPATTRVWLDGAELRREQLGQPLTLRAGEHTVLHSAGDGYPISEVVTVPGAGEKQVRIPAPTSQEPPTGELTASCSVPGLVLAIDGQNRGETPMTRPLQLPSGLHQVSFFRPGYLAFQGTVEVAAHGRSNVACAARPDPSISRQLKASLQLNLRPRSARVLLDGQAFKGAALPLGVHDLRVEREGYAPYQKVVALPARQTTRLDITLTPTPAKRAADEAKGSRRRVVSYVLGGTGAALLATGVGVYVWNGGRYEDWQAERHDATQPVNMNRVASIQRTDDAAVGLMVAGSAMVLGAAWTFFTSFSSSDE